jgi:serine/threonine protein kinase
VEGIQAGIVLGDTYELIAKIGRGGMGEVWRAKHKRLPKEVAVKLLHRLPENDSNIAARFRREAEIASRLNHPNIAEVSDYNLHENGTPYIVMELLNGQSLADALSIGAMDLERTRQIVRQITAALVEAHHQKVIHRDLKPENIFLTPRARGDEHVTVLDFGTSKILDSTSLQTKTATIIGTPMYMAPEQASADNDQVGPHTDQFALALVIYEMLSGKAAFGGGLPASVVYRIVHEEPPPLSELVPGLPKDVLATIEKALQKKREDRFENIAAFCQAFCGDKDRIVRHAVDPMPPSADIGTANTIAYDETAPVPFKKGRPVIIVFLILFSLVAFVIMGLAQKSGSWFAPSTSDELVKKDKARPVSGNRSKETREEVIAEALPFIERRPAAPPTKKRFSERKAPVLEVSTVKVTEKTRKPGGARKVTQVEKVSADNAHDLKTARSALNRGDSQLALRIARKVLRNGGGSPARALITMAHCARGDLGNANAAIHGVERRARSKVLSYCRKKNVVLH